MDGTARHEQPDALPLCDGAERMRDRNRDALLTREELLARLYEGDYTDRALSDMREAYMKTLGFDPVWRYPFCDGAHLGAVIIPVKEGFLWLPYDECDKEDHEIYIPCDASLLDAESCEFLLQDMQDYVTALSAIMRYIADELRASESGTHHK